MRWRAAVGGQSYCKDEKKYKKKTPTTSLRQDLQVEKRGRGFWAPCLTTMKMMENAQMGDLREKEKKDGLLTAEPNKPANM